MSNIRFWDYELWLTILTANRSQHEIIVFYYPGEPYLPIANAIYEQQFVEHGYIVFARITPPELRGKEPDHEHA